MRLAFIGKHRKDMPLQRMCQFRNVSPREYHALPSRPICASQSADMVVRAHMPNKFETRLVASVGHGCGRSCMKQDWLRAIAPSPGSMLCMRLLASRWQSNAKSQKKLTRTRTFRQPRTAPIPLTVPRTCSNGLLGRLYQLKLWTHEISKMGLKCSWRYLAMIHYRHSRRVTGWGVSSRTKRNLAIHGFGGRPHTADISK